MRFAASRRLWILLCVCGAAAAMLTGAVEAGARRQGDVIEATLGGASTGGYHALVGEAVSEVVRRQYPGSSIGYEPGSHVGQLVRTVRGEIDLSLQTAVELRLAMEGYAVFPRPYHPDELTILAKVLDRQEVVLFVRADFAEQFSIDSLDDLRMRRPPLRLSFYHPGNLFARGLVFGEIFAAYGITEAEVKRWGGVVHQTASAESRRLMVDRKLDLWASATFHPDEKTLEVARSVSLRPVRIDPQVIDRAASRFGLKAGYLPAGTYDFLPEDYYTALVPMYLLASPALAADVAYKIVSALYQHFDYFREAHPSFRTLSAMMLAESDGFVIHPGARRFFDEKGLLGTVAAVGE